MSKSGKILAYLSHINKIRKVILKYHPDPFAAAGPEKFELVYKDICNSISDDMTDSEFFIQLSRYISLLNDYHSFLIFTEKVYTKHLNPLKTLPLDIQKMSGGFYILGCKGYDKIINKKIKKINGNDVSNVIESLREYTIYETESNFNLKVLDHLKQPEFLSKILKEPDEICYLLEDNQELIFSCNDACFRETIHDSPNTLFIYYTEEQSEVFRHRKYFFFENSPKNNELLILNNSIGYFKLEICMDSGISNSLQKFFHNVFKKNINRIILDLRGNPGGMVISGLHFISFLKLKEKDFCTGIYFRKKAGLWLHNPLHAITHLLYMIVFKKSNHRKESSQYLMKGGTERNVKNIKAYSWAGLLNIKHRIQKTTEKYSGEVIILTDGWTGSAAVILINIIKNLYPNHRIVGSYPAEYPNLTDNIFSIKISDKYRLYLPSAKHFFNARDLKPEITIEQTIEDYINKKDTVLEYALNLE